MSEEAFRRVPALARGAGRRRRPNLVLIGFMGTGKSHVGRLCAKELRYRFYDSDRVIEQRVGCAVSEYFAQEGEAEFRQREQEVLADLSASAGLVIATGGGAILNPENVANLQSNGVIVLLTASVEAIQARVGQKKTRPLLADAEDMRTRIETMLATRKPYYEQAARYIVDTSERVPEEVCAEVLRVFRAQEGEPNAL